MVGNNLQYGEKDANRKHSVSLSLGITSIKHGPQCGAFPLSQADVMRRSASSARPRCDLNNRRYNHHPRGSLSP